MVLIATVTKKSVTAPQKRLWNVTLNMVLKDDGAEVVNKDYSVEYTPGDSVGDKQVEWATMMQADIDKYKSEMTIYNAAALNNVVAKVVTVLEV